jgi:hypothetical protein
VLRAWIADKMGNATRQSGGGKSLVVVNIQGAKGPHFFLPHP